MIQRYIVNCVSGDESVQRCADGDFVTYKDYAELEKQRDEWERRATSNFEQCAKMDERLRALRMRR